MFASCDKVSLATRKGDSLKFCGYFRARGSALFETSSSKLRDDVRRRWIKSRRSIIAMYRDGVYDARRVCDADNRGSRNELLRVPVCMRARAHPAAIKVSAEWEEKKRKHASQSATMRDNASNHNKIY